MLPFGRLFSHNWVPIEPTLATWATNPVNPGHPGRLLGVPKHSGLDFFRFAIDFDVLQTPEIIEKPLENLSFSMIFKFSVKSLPNPKKIPMGRAGALKMEARAAQNRP